MTFWQSTEVRLPRQKGAKMTKRVRAMLFRSHRLPLGFLALFIAVALSAIVPTSRAEAACTVPNQISNGQAADATKVMGNFDAVKDCINSVVTSSGPPDAGNLPVFTGPNSVASGNLSGDCTTSGSLAVTCTKSNGVALSPLATSTDASQLTGTVSVNRFNNGVNADTTHFLRGDGQWVTLPASGGSATPPTIRSSNIQSFNASSVTITWPIGTVAGDAVIIFVSDGLAVNNPAGWGGLNNTGSNDWANGLTAAKVMTAADITAGSVTVTLIGAYYGVAAAVTIDGSTLARFAEVSAQRSSGSTSYSSASVGRFAKALDTDLIIGFTYIRGAMNPSISNFSQLQLVNAANASGFLGRFTSTFGKLGMAETATYPSSNNGYYWSLVALRTSPQ